MNYRNTQMRVMMTVLLILLMAAVPTALFAGGEQEQQEKETEKESTMEKEAESSYKSFEGEHAAQWKLEAGEPLIIGGYGDNFAYDGENVRPVEGSATVNVNADEDTGTMEAVFNGTITPEKASPTAERSGWSTSNIPLPALSSRRAV